MASRPQTTTDPAKALGRTIANHERRIRSLELTPAPTSTGGGGGSGAWCEIQTSGWVQGASGFAQANLDSIWDQSSGAGFTTDGAQTITVPTGRYYVEWVFEFSFLFENPFAGIPTTYFGNGWTLWHGGVDDTANTVFCNDVWNLETGAVEYVDYGGGDAGLIPYNSGSQVAPFVWTRLIESVPGNDQLTLQIADFYKFFGPILDLSAPLTISDLATANGTGGHHNVIIASVGA